MMIFIIPALVALAAAVIILIQRNAYEARILTINQSCNERIAEIQRACELRISSEREMTSERFRVMADDVLRDTSRRFDQESVVSLQAILAPVKDSLDHFRRSYRECYDSENRERSSLREEIRQLHDLNIRVGAEAARLSSALKGNTGVQGRWGEMVLVNILEHSGLERSRWFATQESSTGENGARLRPDAVIHCPGNRDIIIDSKTNITHYLRAIEADNESERNELMKEHVRAVERQMSSLSKKEYQNNIGAKNGDFVVMFMPHEGAYIAAMESRPTLWEQAYEKHVIIASPTHLVTVVRLVEQMWQSHDTTENAIRIADTASTMLDSVATFMADFETLGKTINKASREYESVVKRLSGGNNNILRVAERLRQLGVRART